MGHLISPLSGTVRAGAEHRRENSGRREREGRRLQKPRKRCCGNDFSSLFACAVVPVSAFSSPPQPLSVRGSGNCTEVQGISLFMSNEEFIRDLRGCGQCSRKLWGGWWTEPGTGGFLVSYIYLDRKGDFKGWFFEEFPPEATWPGGSPGPWANTTPP